MAGHEPAPEVDRPLPDRVQPVKVGATRPRLDERLHLDPPVVVEFLRQAQQLELVPVRHLDFDAEHPRGQARLALQPLGLGEHRLAQGFELLEERFALLARRRTRVEKKLAPEGVELDGSPGVFKAGHGPCIMAAPSPMPPVRPVQALDTAEKRAKRPSTASAGDSLLRCPFVLGRIEMVRPSPDARLRRPF